MARRQRDSGKATPDGATPAGQSEVSDYPRANLIRFAQFATSPVSMRDSIPNHDDPISVVDSMRLMPFLIVPVAKTGDQIEHHQNPSGENPRRLRACWRAGF
jgi:hypothetical protein